MWTLATIAAVVLVDQSTKSIAEYGLITASWIEPSTNPDLALGILGGASSVEVLAGTLGIWLGWMVLRRFQGDLASSVAVGLTLGGAVANLIDRLLLGEVRDFIVGPKILFNLADVALLAGLALLLVLRVRARHGLATSGT